MATRSSPTKRRTTRSSRSPTLVVTRSELQHPGVKSSAAGYLTPRTTPTSSETAPVIVADAYNCRILELGTSDHPFDRAAGHCTHDPPRYLGVVNGDTPLPNGHIPVSEITAHTSTSSHSGKSRASSTRRRFPTRQTPNSLATATSSGRLQPTRRAGHPQPSYRARALSYCVAAGWGMPDHPSLAAMLPNGMIAVNDDYNDRVVIINPQTHKIVWQYGHPTTRAPPQLSQHTRRLRLHPRDPHRPASTPLPSNTVGDHLRSRQARRESSDGVATHALEH